MAADVAVHLLSTLEKHRGDVTCGNLKRKRGLSDIDAFSLSEVDVYAFISALKDKTISQDEFDDIYQLAVKDLVDNEEIDTVRRDNGINLLIARNAQISLGCRLRLKLSSIARKWRLEFSTLVALFLGYTFALTKIRRATAEKKRVKELVKYTIEHVRERMVESMHDPAMAPYVIPEQIRDNALADIHSSAERQKLWSRVRSVVESNANIQLKQLEIQGDITDVFEWKSS
ncbi:hypothetical protein E3P94_00934 [Wallemia ichthyophaga]|nr:hypothetical protein E3P95_00802 [Wallemia ichthyophaga]TIB03617.1 hypothetical protein E3P94_00934 [Wallemia ichthyophaga]